MCEQLRDNLIYRMNGRESSLGVVKRKEHHSGGRYDIRGNYDIYGLSFVSGSEKMHPQ
jgi:hypothetical protein